MNLKDASIVGYFSLPPVSLAEHNPAAYTAAMAGAPNGAGTCAHCGTGIRHHVIIRDAEGKTRFIGTDCAERVGLDAEQIRHRLTDEQIRERNVRRAAAQADWQRKEQERREQAAAYLALRREQVGDLIDLLCRIGTPFHASLADQLALGPLSERQAQFVAKLTSATGRRNRANADAWDAILDRCTSLS